jgi:hypothetical protein
LPTIEQHHLGASRSLINAQQVTLCHRQPSPYVNL